MLSLNISFAMVLSVALLACDRKPEGTSAVTIQFPATANRVSSAASSQVSASGSSDWNATPLRTISEVNCFAVFVATKNLPISATCTNALGAQVISAGAFRGLIAAGGSASVEVPSGDVGRITIAGMRSSNGSCENAEQGAQITNSNYSNPYVLGAASVELKPGAVDVQISLGNDLVDANKIGDCSFLGQGSGGGSSPSPSPTPLQNFALGQPSTTANNNALFGLSQPTVVMRTGSKLVVGDCVNKRVLVWNSVPTSATTAPDLVLGQSNPKVVNTGGAISATSIGCPAGLATDGSNLVVSDSSNSRVLIWNSFPTSATTSADLVLGQPGFTTGTINNGGIGASALSQPGSVAISGSKLIVADRGNNRVLIWNSFPTMNQQGADVVVGQSTFTGSSTGCSPTGMSSPYDVDVSSGDLIVADGSNSRVLRFSPIPSTSGASATNVIGKSTLSGCTGGVTQSGLSTLVKGARVFGGNLFVADTNANRVLVWNTVPVGNGANADFVLGQASFTTSSAAYPPTASSFFSPVSVASGGTDLWVVDFTNNRVLSWNSAPTANQAADFVWGQGSMGDKNVNSPGGNSSVTLNGPAGVDIFGTRLFVADTTNNRILIWNSLPSLSQKPAEHVLGQSDFVSVDANRGSSANAGALKAPTSVRSDGTRLVVADTGNNRVLIWNAVPTASNVDADRVLGQLTFITTGSGSGTLGLNAPRDAVSDGTRLVVADTGNHRVVIWNSIPSVDGQSADIFLGQPSAGGNTANNGGISASTMSQPSRVFISGNKLLVADLANHRVLIWNSLSTVVTGQAADVELGQPGFITSVANSGGVSGTSMASPKGIWVDANGRLYVSENANNRVLVWNSIPTVNATAANAVFGQTSMSVAGLNATAPDSSSLYAPNAIAVSGSSLWIADTFLNRILRTPIP